MSQARGVATPPRCWVAGEGTCCWLPQGGRRGGRECQGRECGSRGRAYDAVLLPACTVVVRAWSGASLPATSLLLAPSLVLPGVPAVVGQLVDWDRGGPLSGCFVCGKTRGREGLGCTRAEPSGSTCSSALSLRHWRRPQAPALSSASLRTAAGCWTYTHHCYLSSKEVRDAQQRTCGHVAAQAQPSSFHARPIDQDIAVSSVILQRARGPWRTLRCCHHWHHHCICTYWLCGSGSLPSPRAVLSA